jgi:hypothetical protein
MMSRRSFVAGIAAVDTMKKPTVEGEFLKNGNLRIGGVGGFEIEPPHNHPARANARWTMLNARGNLIVGSYREGSSR